MAIQVDLGVSDHQYSWVAGSSWSPSFTHACPHMAEHVTSCLGSPKAPAVLHGSAVRHRAGGLPSAHLRRVAARTCGDGGAEAEQRSSVA